LSYPLGLASGVGLWLETGQIDTRLRIPAGLAVFGDNIGENAATHVKLGGKAHETRLGNGDKVVQNAVGHVFMKMPFFAE